jgi:hypothetical protein
MNTIRYHNLEDNPASLLSAKCEEMLIDDRISIYYFMCGMRTQENVLSKNTSPYDVKANTVLQYARNFQHMQAQLIV